MTRFATDLARFVTPLAAFETVLRLGRPTPFRLLDARFLLPLRFAEDLRADDLRDAARFAPDFRAELRFLALAPRELDLRAEDLRADDFRADDLRADDFRREPPFLPPFEPPRDDFLAAAMIRAPIKGFDATL